MTDKEKRELKDGVISIFKRFNILDHTATIGGLRDDILRYIDSLQEEPVSDTQSPVIFYGLTGSVGSPKEEPVSDELEKVVEEIVDPTVLNAYGVEEIANRLRRTMIEPVSKELEEASKEWLRPQLDKFYTNYGEAKMMELTHFDGYAMLDAIEFGAKWKEEKDQEAVEIAKKEVIEETAEWLTKHAKKYYFNKDRYLGTDELVEDYKLIMSM